jgi:virulence factor Mce-like protein
MSQRTHRRTGPITRQRLSRVVAYAGLGLAAIAIAAIVAGGGKSPYVVYAQFTDAGGMRQGFKVRIDGAPVGQVESLDLGRHDYAVAKLDIDRSAAPVGRDAHATVRAADLLGEKYVDLQPGNRQDPAPSGSVIPPARTALAVELDDVLNALDVQTRDGLRIFINEQGTAFAGRGGDLAATLAALPPSLDQTQQFLSQFGQDNAALGRLVDESDRVIGAVAQQRAPLGRLVASAAGTLQTLASRRDQLGATVANAPGMLVSLRRALAALQGAATPLGPAAQGLAATAPALTSTLAQLPAFYAAAKPTLDVVRQVAPTLRTLGLNASPVVRRLQPLTGELATFSSALDPVTTTLDHGIGDILGVLEGWARATQARDAASHVFRFGVTIGPGTFDSLSPLLTPAQAHKRLAQQLAAPARSALSVAAAPSPPAAVAKPVAGVAKPLSSALTRVSSTVGAIRSTLTRALAKVGLGAGSGGTGGSGGSGSGAGSHANVSQLLNYLLK